MIRMQKLTALLKTEVAFNKIYENLSEVEKIIYKEKATGVTETKVYSGPEGSIHKQEMLDGTQYRALHKK
jgi:hypothetical protein